jgi:hypothetical protein
MNNFEAQLYGAFARMDAKSKRGGKRAGAGRKVGPGGPRTSCSLRLTLDVAEYCRQHPDGFGVLESTLRASKAFEAWIKNQERSGGE